MRLRVVGLRMRGHGGLKILSRFVCCEWVGVCEKEGWVSKVFVCARERGSEKGGLITSKICVS